MPNTIKYTRLFRTISVICSAIVFSVGASVILGWYLDNNFLKGAYNGGFSVKVNTGICFVLISASLYLVNLKLRSELRIFSNILAITVLTVATLTFLQHLTGFNFGIDEMLMSEGGIYDIATVSPGRMGPPASLCFIYASLALILINQKKINLINYATVLSIIMGIMSLLPLLGYLYGVTELFSIARITGIALNTAITFLLLSFGIFFACTNGSILTLLKSQNAGGFLMRRMLLPALAIPTILGWLRTVGQTAGYYDAGFGRALLVLAFTIIFASLIIYNAKILRKNDQEKKDLLESERAARTEAENASRLKDDFLATLSHELRTPLNAILGWAQILKQGKIQANEQIKGLEVIERNAKLQAQFIEEMLDLSRAVSGKLVLNIRPIELVTLLKTCVQTVIPSASSKKIDIHTDVSAEKVELKGDLERLVQVFTNLLTNAIKFTPEEGKIYVTLSTDSGYARITIKDTGQGIKKEFLETIFDRFRQADGSITRRFGGLGIGLSIVRDLVSLHGGSVIAASDGEGKGAIFNISLPLNTEEAHVFPKEERAALEEALRSNVNLAGIKILVVDDNSETRELVQRILESCDAEVILADSAKDALFLIESEKPNILVSDIGMPDQDGYEFIKVVRSLADKDSQNIPAIALTAFARSHDKARAIHAGFHYHLTKPIEAGELITAITNAMQLKTA